MDKIKENKVGIALTLAGLAGLFLYFSSYSLSPHTLTSAHPLLNSKPFATLSTKLALLLKI